MITDVVLFFIVPLANVERTPGFPLSDTMPCPGCRATLRVPAGAAAIRCPACKTVIPLAAPAAAPAPAIPLPFGGPPAAPPPPPPPAVARANPPVRAAEYRDDDPEPDETKPRKDAPKRNSLLEFDDDELNDEERREKRRLERLLVECKPAQTGVTVLAYAYGADAVGYLMGFLYLVVAAFGAPIVPIAWLAIGLHVLAVGGQILGLGFCCGGPRANRSVAYFGLGTTVLAFLTLGVAFIYCLMGHAVIVSGAGLFEGGKVGYGDMALWVLAPLAPTLELLSFPLWIADGSFRGGAWLIIIPGLFELARHTYAAVLVRSYCEDGKAPELGWTVSRFMTRIYAAFGTFFVSRLIALGLIVGNATTRDDTGLLIFLSLTYAGAIAALAMAMVAQAYVLTDAAEVIDYKRFALKGGRLDSV